MDFRVDGHRTEYRVNSVEQEPAAALIFSESLIREANTGELSLIHCFGMFNAPSIPFPAAPFFCHCSRDTPPRDAEETQWCGSRFLPVPSAATAIGSGRPGGRQ